MRRSPGGLCSGALLALSLGMAAIGETRQETPRLVGLVELPGLFGAPDPDGPPGSRAPDPFTPVPVHATPDTGTRRFARITAPDEVEWREFAYEAPAAMAYGESDGWVRVAIGEADERRYGWVPPEHRGTLHRLPELLENGLAYLTAEWDGRLRERPASASPSTDLRADVAERPDVNVLRSVEADGITWLEVELLGPGRCVQASPAAVRATGWVPALAPDGSPNAWFYSRGC